MPFFTSADFKSPADSERLDSTQRSAESIAAAKLLTVLSQSSAALKDPLVFQAMSQWWDRASDQGSSSAAPEIAKALRAAGFHGAEPGVGDMPPGAVNFSQMIGHNVLQALDGIGRFAQAGTRLMAQHAAALPPVPDLASRSMPPSTAGRPPSTPAAEVPLTRKERADMAGTMPSGPDMGMEAARGLGPAAYTQWANDQMKRAEAMDPNAPSTSITANAKKDSTEHAAAVNFADEKRTAQRLGPAAYTQWANDQMKRAEAMDPQATTPLVTNELKKDTPPTATSTHIAPADTSSLLGKLEARRARMVDPTPRPSPAHTGPSA